MSNTNVFVSFSFEEENFKIVNKIIDTLRVNKQTIDYSEKQDRSDNTDETIWKYLLNRMHGSSVTIVVLTKDLLTKNRHKISSGNQWKNCGWVYKEISASLRNWENNNINGIIVVYDDELEFYLRNINYRMAKIIDFNRNNLKNYNNGLDKDYINIVSLSSFLRNPIPFINKAKDKREYYEYYNIKYDFHN